MGTTLREIFTPLLAYALLFARTPSYQQRSFAEIRGEVDRLLEEQKILIKRNDLSVSDYESARFAVVAWLDEIILRSTYDTNHDLYQQWTRSLLQVTFYNTANAGEEFFERLEQLSPGQKDIREIYYLCLCLGFRGRYYAKEQEDTLIALRRELGQHLPTPTLDLYEIEKRKEQVTPQPYTVQPPVPRPLPQPPSPLWIVFPLLAIVALGVYWLWPSRPQEVPSPPPGLQIGDIEAQLQRFPCSQITVADVQNGVVQLEGRVESEEQHQQVQQAVRAVPGVTEVRDSFSLLPRPFCEVLSLLQPLQKRGDDSGFGLRVRPSKGCDVVYYRKENLVLDLSAQKPLPYVYVDYYVADREAVAHLLPNPRQPDNAPRGTSTITIGDANSKARWQIEPPFGMELVTVIASPQPLFAQPRVVAAERVTTYLAELRKVLPSDGANSEVVASYCFITTEDR